MIERIRSKPIVKVPEPTPVFIKGKWIYSGNIFRAWYVVNGKIKVVDVAGMSSWAIKDAMTRSSVETRI